VIWTTGYAGWIPEEFEARVKTLGAFVVDIRFSPWSKDRTWIKPALLERFGSKGYAHLRALGNRNFKGGSIQLENPAFGVGAVEMLHKTHGNVILLCACRDASTCHRTVVAELLREHWLTVEELERP
jgi:uncharacterized protein (DUF488 family)